MSITVAVNSFSLPRHPTPPSHRSSFLLLTFQCTSTCRTRPKCHCGTLFHLSIPNEEGLVNQITPDASFYLKLQARSQASHFSPPSAKQTERYTYPAPLSALIFYLSLFVVNLSLHYTPLCNLAIQAQWLLRGRMHHLRRYDMGFVCSTWTLANETTPSLSLSAPDPQVSF